MTNLKDFAMNILAQNPQIANNPNARNMIQAIQSGDDKRGEEIAKNLCNAYGITPQQAVEDAKRFFNIPF